MKKILLFAAAVLAMASCTEPTIEPTPETVDSISLSAESKTFTKEAGSVKVMVTSSSEWTLAAKEEYNWATASVEKGGDGDVVEFSVIENLEENREALYTFTCGKATADFKIISIAGEKPVLTLVSPAEVSGDYNEGDLTIKVTCPTGYRNVKATVPEADAAWLHYKANMSGDTDNDAEIHFTYDVLGGLENRETVITLSADGMEPLTVKFTQLAKLVLKVEKEFYNAKMEGEDLTVAVTTNVEYDITIAPEGEGWLTYKSKAEGAEVFTVAALAEGKRAAVVTLTQKNAAEGTEALTAQFTVTQVNAIITWAADMNNNRLFPKWVNNRPAFEGGPDFPKCTVEMLFYANELTKQISSLMGVEGEFLVRLGDAGLQPNIIQIATPNGDNHACYSKPVTPKQWHHIAVVMKWSRVNVYLDGENIGDFTVNNYGLPIGRLWSIDEKFKGSQYRCWWYGYSWDENRSLNGMMTEIRMWDKPLTAEEINAPDHFYKVDPASEGLISYWKFTEGEGATIADKSEYSGAMGEPLYGDIDYKKDAQEVIRGTEGIEWVPVVLPEK